MKIKPQEYKNTVEKCLALNHNIYGILEEFVSVIQLAKIKKEDPFDIVTIEEFPNMFKVNEDKESFKLIRELEDHLSFNNYGVIQGEDELSHSIIGIAYEMCGISLSELHSERETYTKRILEIQKGIEDAS